MAFEGNRSHLSPLATYHDSETQSRMASELQIAPSSRTASAQTERPFEQRFRKGVYAFVLFMGVASAALYTMEATHFYLSVGVATGFLAAYYKIIDRKRVAVTTSLLSILALGVTARFAIANYSTKIPESPMAVTQQVLPQPTVSQRIPFDPLKKLTPKITNKIVTPSDQYPEAVARTVPSWDSLNNPILIQRLYRVRQKVGWGEVSNRSYSSDPARGYLLMIHPAVKSLADDWMEGKLGEGLPFAAVAQVTSRGDGVLNERDAAPLMAYLYFKEINRLFPGEPFKLTYTVVPEKDKKGRLIKGFRYYKELQRMLGINFKKVPYFETHTDSSGGGQGLVTPQNNPRGLLLPKIGGNFMELGALDKLSLMTPAQFQGHIESFALLLKRRGIGNRPVNVETRIHRGGISVGTDTHNLDLSEHWVKRERMASRQVYVSDVRRLLNQQLFPNNEIMKRIILSVVHSDPDFIVNPIGGEDRGKQALQDEEIFLFLGMERALIERALDFAFGAWENSQPPEVGSATRFVIGAYRDASRVLLNYTHSETGFGQSFVNAEGVLALLNDPAIQRQVKDIERMKSVILSVEASFQNADQKVILFTIFSEILRQFPLYRDKAFRSYLFFHESVFGAAFAGEDQRPFIVSLNKILQSLLARHNVFAFFGNTPEIQKAILKYPKDSFVYVTPKGGKELLLTSGVRGLVVTPSNELHAIPLAGAVAFGIKALQIDKPKEAEPQELERLKGLLRSFTEPVSGKGEVELNNAQMIQLLEDPLSFSNTVILSFKVISPIPLELVSESYRQALQFLLSL